MTTIMLSVACVLVPFNVAAGVVLDSTLPTRNEKCAAKGCVDKFNKGHEHESRERERDEEYWRMLILLFVVCSLVFYCYLCHMSTKICACTEY